MTLQQFLLILRARWKMALLAFAITVATTVVVSMLMPKQYTASAAVVVDVRSPDPVSGLMLQGMMAPGYMATQVDIINSDRVAQAVVKGLGMEDSPAIQPSGAKPPRAKASCATGWLAAAKKPGRKTQPRKQRHQHQLHRRRPRLCRRRGQRLCTGLYRREPRPARGTSPPVRHLFRRTNQDRPREAGDKPSKPCLTTSRKTALPAPTNAWTLKPPSSTKPAASSPACKARPPTAKASAAAARPTPWPKSCKAR